VLEIHRLGVFLLILVIFEVIFSIMHLTVVYAENVSWTTKEMDRDGKGFYELLRMIGIIMLKR
jgi:hypothetical protein